MEELPEINMIKFSALLFKFVGESKMSTTRVLGCLRIFNVIMMAIPLWFAFANFFFIEGEMYVQALQSSLFFAHALLKYVSFLNYKTDIRELMNEIVNRFWNHRRCGKNVTREIEGIYRTVEGFQRAMLMVAGFGIIMYMMKPFFASNRGLLLESLVPRSNAVDVILLFSQFYCFSVGVPFVLGYDFIYLALCAHIVLQFRLLKSKMRDILNKHDGDTASQISICVRHHQFMFTIFWRMQKAYSVMLLFHYVGTLITTCALFLEVLRRRTNFTNYIAKLFTVLVFTGQFALYVFPAEQVTSEFLALSDIIYTSLWYKNNITNQKMVLYVMMVAQRVNSFSGAGLVKINIDAFESVFRKSFSFYAVLKSIIEE